MVKKKTPKKSMNKDMPMSELSENVSAILETVNFIKDNAVTKTELNELRNELRGNVHSLRSDFGAMKADMVTKDYLDNKLADLRGDLVVLTRKEDMKVKELIKILEDKKILNKAEVKKILTMEPFPQLAL